MDFFIQIDINLFLFLNKFHSAFLDEIMWLISFKYTWIPLYLTIIFFLFKKYKWKGFIPIILILLAVSLANLISVQLFKNIFQRFRPCHNPDISEIVHLVKNHCGGKYGFISSHATNTFVIVSNTF